MSRIRKDQDHDQNIYEGGMTVEKFIILIIITNIHLLTCPEGEPGEDEGVAGILIQGLRKSRPRQPRPRKSRPGGRKPRTQNPQEDLGGVAEGKGRSGGLLAEEP